MQIGILIRQLREAKGLSQENLADAAGINQGVLSRYESGRRTPPVEALETISNALGGAPEVMLASCGNCPVIQALKRYYDMPTEDELRIKQMLKENRELSEELEQLAANPPQEDSAEYLAYLARVKQIMNTISVSSAAYGKAVGTG